MKAVSPKRLKIDKANVMIVTVVAIACFVTVFALTVSKTLWSQRGYQAKVIGIKEDTKTQLQANLKARDQLVAQYKLFVSTPTNVIGGNSEGTGERDGDNARIALGALPSKYDYPALATSLEKLMTTNGVTITNISGTDDELNQAGATSAQPVDMPFVISFDGTPDDVQKFLTAMQRSIRPIQALQMTITGNDAKLSVTITAKTYYQPEKKLDIRSEVVK